MKEIYINETEREMNCVYLCICSENMNGKRMSGEMKSTNKDEFLMVLMKKMLVLLST